MVPEVLVIEDVVPIRQVITKLIESINYTAFPAANISEALTYLRDHNVSAVVLDMNLADGETGFDFLQELAKSDLNEQVPVIILTADDTSLYSPLIKDDPNVVSVLIKPYGIRVLRDELKQKLHKQKQKLH